MSSTLKHFKLKRRELEKRQQISIKNVFNVQNSEQSGVQLSVMTSTDFSKDILNIQNNVQCGGQLYAMFGFAPSVLCSLYTFSLFLSPSAHDWTHVDVFRRLFYSTNKVTKRMMNEILLKIVKWSNSSRDPPAAAQGLFWESLCCHVDSIAG